MHVWTTRILSTSLVILSCWTPELATAGQTATTTNQQSTSTQAAPPTANSAGTASGSQLDKVLPDAPSQAQATATSATSPDQSNTPEAQPQNTPEGTAAARVGKVSGGPASKPAGSAIAPAKQRQVRSLLIKLGAIAGAGVALGTVYALSRSSPTRPPGTR